jgi:SUKH-4 immunity protein
MIDNFDMIRIFGKDELVCSRSENVLKSELPDITKDFISRVCFPRSLNLLRFFMDFSPLSQDPIIGDITKNFGKCYTFGVRFVHIKMFMMNFHSMGLPNNSSLAEIYERNKIMLARDLGFLAESDFTKSPRLCIDLENGGRVISIDPEDFKITFFNSSIQQFAETLALFKRTFSSELSFEEEMQKLDPDAMNSTENWWVIATTELFEEYYTPDDF